MLSYICLLYTSRKRITGARQFERLLSKQTDEEALFGRLDLASLIPGAVPAQVLAKDDTYQSLKTQLAQAAEDFCADPADNAAMAQLQSLTDKLEQYQKGLSLLHLSLIHISICALEVGEDALLEPNTLSFVK